MMPLTAVGHRLNVWCGRAERYTDWL